MKYLLLIVLIVVAAYFGFYFYSMRGIKTPPYTVLKKEGVFEIRQYQPIIIAQTTETGPRKMAINQGFRQLARYIFGNDIKMTAPVMQQADKDQWAIRFVMPANHTIQTLPKPKNSDVKIIKIPEHTVVAIRFSGRMTKVNLKRHLDLLDQYVKDHHLHVIEDPQYAFYNPPWTLPFMRRNEIFYLIQADGLKP